MSSCTLLGFWQPFFSWVNTVHRQIIKYIELLLCAEYIFVLILGFGIFKTYQNLQLAQAIVKKSKETLMMISSYSIKNISKTLRRKTLDKLNFGPSEKGKTTTKAVTETSV